MSFQESSYCGLRPSLQEASPNDIQIVCGDWAIALTPEDDYFFSPEDEVVLEPEEIVNHPNFDINNIISGNDIAVYKVDL